MEDVEQEAGAARPGAHDAPDAVAAHDTIDTAEAHAAKAANTRHYFHHQGKTADIFIP